MKQSLTKLVDVILQKLAEQPDTASTEPGLRSWLKRQGYATRDIDAALKMVDPKFVRANASESGPVRSGNSPTTNPIDCRPRRDLHSCGSSCTN